jgi:hypothetical protein
MITFTKIENEKQLRAHNLDEFAATFGHEVSRLFPIWVGHLDGRLVTYCHMHQQMVAYPAVQPSISPRQFYILTKKWLDRIKAMHGDPLIAMPPGVDARMYSKIGLRPFDKDVYVISD